MRAHRGVARLFHIVLVVASAAVYAEEATRELNREPVSDADFEVIAEHYAYDPEAPLHGVTIGRWTHEIPYVLEKVSFQSSHDEIVPALFSHPADSTSHPCPAVLLLHGNNGFWGKYSQWNQEWLDILTREGYCVLMPDFYGFGERLRDSSPPPWEGPPYASRDATIQWVTDTRRALDYLMDRPEVDAKQIILMGGSMGGEVATLVGALDHRLKAIVLTVTSAWPVDESTDHPTRRFEHTLNFAPRIEVPVFMVNATKDERGPGEELFHAIPEPKSQIWLETEHYQPPHEHNTEILTWLRVQLR